MSDSMMDSQFRFFTKWLGLSLACVILCYFFLPIREDAMVHMTRFGYHLENIFWLSLTSLSAWGLYQNSLPEKETPHLLAPAFLIILVLNLLALAHDNSDSLGIQGEVDLWRGRCGFLILGVALFHGSFLFRWAKTGTSSRPYLSGLWIGLASGSLGCLLMQVVCAYDNPLHLVLWHFAPIVLLTTSSAILARKFLKW